MPNKSGKRVVFPMGTAAGEMDTHQVERASLALVSWCTDSNPRAAFAGGEFDPACDFSGAALTAPRDDLFSPSVSGLIPERSVGPPE